MVTEHEYGKKCPHCGTEQFDNGPCPKVDTEDETDANIPNCEVHKRPKVLDTSGTNAWFCPACDRDIALREMLEYACKEVCIVCREPKKAEHYFGRDARHSRDCDAIRRVAVERSGVKEET